jgi:hypothetical protein
MTHKATPLPDQSELRRLLDYDPDTGALTWRQRSEGPAQWNGKWAGRPAFTARDTRGYHRGMVQGVQTSAHRLAWKWMTGEDPEYIDHINGDPADNRFHNLRSVSHQENCRNTKTRSDSSAGHPGVSFAKREGKWRAYVKLKTGKQHSLGYFDTKSEAIAARRAAHAPHGYHANHGRAS